ncbi:sensor histidine kinase [Amycolatopsis sp. NPDC059021]|uniref:sensor histidine kinase n=1 Tax=Amycolatopsis sp. NPDC059021 TaxID=3346704 RepID=UPI00366DD7CF
MRQVGLRTRLTVVYTVMFVAASAVVVSLVYLANRDSLLHLMAPIPRTPQIPQIGAPPLPVPEVVQQPLDSGVDDALDKLVWASVGTFLSLGAIAALLGWWLTGKVLNRVHRIAEQARRISTANLHERIALTGPRDETRELSDTLDGLLDRLDQAFHAQERFIANASHELRTPLAVTRTAIQVGLGSVDSPELLRVKQYLLRSNDKSIALINGLLQLMRGKQGLHSLVPTRFDEITRRTVQETGSNNPRIELDVVPCETLGDELLLGQVVRNLVDNAVRYNIPSTEDTEGKVTLDLRPVKDSACLRVSNTGPVVPADEVEQLFEPFRRGAQRAGHPEGSGLGLSIVRAIVTAHSGHVSAVSQPEGGLTVTVNIPLALSGTGTT